MYSTLKAFIKHHIIDDEPEDLMEREEIIAKIARLRDTAHKVAESALRAETNAEHNAEMARSNKLLDEAAALEKILRDL
jgi:hypothetical protein